MALARADRDAAAAACFFSAMSHCASQYFADANRDLSLRATRARVFLAWGTCPAANWARPNWSRAGGA